MQSIQDEAYLSHEIFKKLNLYADFYDSLSFSVLSYGTLGLKGLANIDTYVFSSMFGTLESIHGLLLNGRINDAYALLRKYHDSVIINIYANLYLQQNFDIENFIVQHINDWVKGAKSLPRFSVMVNYIEKSDKLSEIANLIHLNNTYHELRARCDDHMHYNFFKFLVLNDNKVSQDRINTLDDMEKDIENVFIQHLAYLFSLNDVYMRSSDVIDAIDAGITPDEDMQYYVAPFIQATFDEVLKKKRPDIAKVILDNTDMQLI